MAMKRGREVTTNIETLTMVLLSKIGETESVKKGTSNDRVFVCKTCNREFSSFQALGGHRASHKKLKLSGGGDLQLPTSPVKPKTHECTICGLEFPLGQALGGHMRRHRQEIQKDVDMPLLPVLKKLNSSKRIMCSDLDLDLDLDLHLGFSPPKDDLKLRLMTPTVTF